MSYRCGVWADLKKLSFGGIKLLMLDDKTVTTVPSAVVYFVGAGLPSGDSL
ncbi:MAG: hypothetical protein ACFCU5_13690 [Pleurocapsa sp.]